MCSVLFTALFASSQTTMMSSSSSWLQVKIWFQNRRSKYKKIMKQGGTPPGPPLQCPGGPAPPNAPPMSSAPSPTLQHQHTPPQHSQGASANAQQQPQQQQQQQLSPPGEMPPQSGTPHGLVPPGSVGSVHGGVPPSSTPQALLPVSASMSPPQPSWSDMQQHMQQTPNSYMTPYGSWYPQGVAPVHMNSAC